MSRVMRDSQVEWLGQIPASWNTTKHKWVMQKEKRICDKYSGEDIISLTTKGVIKRDLINPSGKMPATFDGYQIVKNGNLLLCLFDIDVTPRCVGLIEDDGLTSPAYSQFKTINNNHAPYYNYLLQTIDDRKDFLHLSKNLRSSLKEDDFGNINTINPPLAQQKAITIFLEHNLPKIETIIERTKSTIEDYKLLKQSIITEAVTKGFNETVGMKDSGIASIGDVPQNWIVTKIKHEAYLRARLGWKGLTADEYVDKGIIFLATPNIKEFEIDFTNVNYISRERYEESSEIKLSVGDVLLTKDGSTLGTLNVVRYLPDEATINGSIALITPSEDLHSIYLYYYLKGTYIQNQIKLKKDGMGVPHLFQRDIREFYVLLPPKEEQIEISEYLDSKCKEFDKLILMKQSLLVSLEEYKKSLIYECVTGKKEVL